MTPDWTPPPNHHPTLPHQHTTGTFNFQGLNQVGFEIQNTAAYLEWGGTTMAVRQNKWCVKGSGA